MFVLMMGPSKTLFTQMGFRVKAENIPKCNHKHASRSLWVCSVSCSKLTITCGLRGGPRKSLWKSRVLSSEAIHAVQLLKLAKSTSKLEEVCNNRLSRLLKGDLMDTLAELQRQNEWKLASLVFQFMQEKLMYKPDLSMYHNMILLYGKNKMIELVEQLFLEVKKLGLRPDSRTYNEMIGAFLQADMVEKAMEMYKLMKDSGCSPDTLTYTILIRYLEKAGEHELASAVKIDCAKYVESPEKFLEEVAKKYPKRKSLTLI